MARNPIQKKLLKGTMSLVIPMFIAIIGAIVFLTMKQNQSFLEKTELQIRKGIMAKGKTLIANNAQALSGMVSDNAFTAVQSLVAKTVQEDDDVVFGIYMTAEEQQAWVFANDSNPEGLVDGVVIFEDSTSNHIAQAKDLGHIEHTLNDKNIIEFYSPVYLEDETLGYVRYGLSTSSLEDAIANAKSSSNEALKNLLLTILGIGLFAGLMAFYRAKKQAELFSHPIQELSEATDRIANGNYSESVNIISDDEVGDLAHSFERMRATIQTYTEHLQELVDEKMRQVRDILDNIDQGLFTVNLDGTINEEYSKSTNKILMVDDICTLNIYQTFKMNPSQTNDWNDWIGLIKQRHNKIRWNKLLKLAPILEVEIKSENENKYIKVDYQPVLSNNGSINRIMVLVYDITDARRIERIVAEEKLRHDNEVKTILGLVNNIPESIQEFFNETDQRLFKIEESLENIKQIILNSHSVCSSSLDTTEIDKHALSIFSDLHTIKGTAATFGFEQLSFIANNAEDLLENFKTNNTLCTISSVEKLYDKIKKVREERVQIDNVSKKLHGGDPLTVQVLESKIDFIDKLCHKFETDPITKDNKAIQTLSEACLSLRHLPISKLCGQYENTVLRTAEKLNKQIRFSITPPEFEVHPSFFKPINEAVIHLLRNAIDHGIEPPQVREKLGKDPTGLIEFKVEKKESHFIFSISDDGGGIDTKKIIDAALKKELITQINVMKINSNEKVNLIFLPGLTTKNIVTGLSGRGIGMNSVKQNLKAIGADIRVESRLGKGSQFIIEIPLDVMNFEIES